MAKERLDPLYGIYDDIAYIVKNVVIKYNYLAEKNETLESKMNGDQYLTAMNKMDSFNDYTSYTREDCEKAGMTNNTDISIIINGMRGISSLNSSEQSYYIKRYNQLVKQYGDAILQVRRQRVIDEYVEQNNYYRMLNGYPNLDEDKMNYFYISDEIAQYYNIDKSIPLHEIQDYYNKITYGLGDYYINIIDGLGYISNLIEDNPESEYLKYIGSNRISIYDARQASNFEILKLDQGVLTNALYEEFSSLYSQARDYFSATIYNTYHRNVIDYYDNFIAMCIMVMTINQLIVRQMDLAISRNFYNKQSIKMLYEAYNIPYNMNIDDDTQKQICQNLNLLIKNKATDKVLYNIIELLGFSNLSIYKYYMVRERKYDDYGVPIVARTKKFNNDTGEYEETYDYSKMFEVYFERCDLKENNILDSFRSEVNKIDYDTIVSDDEYWWEDSNLIKQVWETEYNYVESKYLGLGISYKMTEIMYENIMLLKMLMDQKTPLSSITFTLPKIIDSSTEVTIFDAIIMLCCLTSKSHNLNGEIISVPSQVISVLDYFRNNDSAYNEECDSFAFDFSDFSGQLDFKKHYKYYLENSGLKENEYSYSQYISDLCDEKVMIEGVNYNFREKYSELVNANLSDEFNFKTYPYENFKLDIINGNITFDNIGVELVRQMSEYFTDEEKEKLFKYLSILSINNDATNSDKIIAINAMYTNLKNLSSFINYMISKTKDRKAYDALRTFYRAAFYSKENKKMFSNITGNEICWYDESGGYYIKNHDGDPNEYYSYYDKDHNLISNLESREIFEELYNNGELKVGQASVTRAARTYFEFLYRYNPKAYSALFTTDEDNQFRKYLNDNELTVGMYCEQKYNEYVDCGIINGKFMTFDKYLESLYPSYNIDKDSALYQYGKKEYMNDVYLGKIDSFRYDTLVVDGNLLYSYIDHIVSKMTDIVYNLKFLYIVGKSNSPIEKLLVQMIRFFKSYTVDMIGMETQYIYDIKIDNIIRFFDEIEKINKLLEANDHICIKYDDSVHSLVASIETKDGFKFSDNAKYESWITINNKFPGMVNSIKMTDKVHTIEKTLESTDTYKLYDTTYGIESSVRKNDSLGFHEKVKIFYTE